MTGSTPEDIRRFREWKRDDEIVSGLIPLAAGLRSENRSPATLVLGNVVDNTNVCYVIAYFANTPEIGADGQYNLLQVVQQVASYAFRRFGNAAARGCSRRATGDGDARLSR
ncbi:hypothetical protein NKH10_32435, partial [Mesorhizobium sp. M1340]|uniref:hypothetical protein n=1 Tax=Mesorhizobium sp. M1340 TaxID=2957087 RepID=UPI00333795FF